jgi:NAD(P)H-dependent FMN reductase
MSQTSATNPRLQVLALSGSLRVASSNTRLLKAAMELAPSSMQMELFDGLGNLPHFNPDLDNENPPETVQEFRKVLQATDGVLISCPEYAHGVPGTFKNALDWIVGSGEFMHKPVALFNPSPRAVYAQASLVETLTVMMAQWVPEANVTLSLPGNNLDVEEIASHPEWSQMIRCALQAFSRAIEVSRNS